MGLGLAFTDVLVDALIVGGYLYDGPGYTALVLISTAFTAVGWFLVQGPHA